MNLATRPFYNERAVHLVLGLLGLAAATMSIFGAIELTSLSRTHATLAAAANEDQRRSARVYSETATLQRQIPSADLDALSDAIREANHLIHRRTFSWTEFLNHVESTLPPDVMLTLLRPNIGSDGVGIEVGVIGREVDGIVEFIERLERTGAFEEVLVRQEELVDDGTYRATLNGQYRQEAQSRRND